MSKEYWDIELEILDKSFWLYEVPANTVIDIDREVNLEPIWKVGLDKLEELWNKYGDDVEITMKKISALDNESIIYVTEY